MAVQARQLTVHSGRRSRQVEDAQEVAEAVHFLDVDLLERVHHHQALVKLEEADLVAEESLLMEQLQAVDEFLLTTDYAHLSPALVAACRGAKARFLAGRSAR
jgi:hypothetical protein